MDRNWILTGVLWMYGVLLIIAAIGGWRADGNEPQYLLFILSGLALMVTVHVTSENGKLVVLIAGLLGLHAAALWQGVSRDEIQWSHRVVRAVVSAAILAMFFRFRA